MPKITSKNLQELSELLDGERLAHQKCLFFSTRATDPTLKKKFGTWANNHKKRFEALYDYLNSHE